MENNRAAMQRVCARSTGATGQRRKSPCRSRCVDSVTDRWRSVRLEAFPPSQGGRQLHWLLPERIQQRRRATLWSDRSPRQQTCPGAAGRSSLAAVTLAAQLACPPEILRETQSWRVTQKENGGGTSSTVGHRLVALENR